MLPTYREAAEKAGLALIVVSDPENDFSNNGNSDALHHGLRYVGREGRVVVSQLEVMETPTNLFGKPFAL